MLYLINFFVFFYGEKMNPTEKSEYRYSTTIMVENGNWKSFEDSKKNYGSGTSETKGGGRKAEAMLTAKYDNPALFAIELRNDVGSIEKIMASLFSLAEKKVQIILDSGKLEL